MIAPRSAPATALPAPAIIEQEDTTTLLLPGWRLGVDEFGNLHLTRDAA